MNSNFPYPNFPWSRSLVTRVSCVSFHPTRNFPDPQKRYQVFLGRSFWRLVTFVSSASLTSRASFIELKEERRRKRNTISEDRIDFNEDEDDIDEDDQQSDQKQQSNQQKTPPLPSNCTLTNALVTGVRGSGKSHMLMTAASFMTARNMSHLLRIVCIGDCRGWMTADNPVAYFSLELMMAFRTQQESDLPDKSNEKGGNGSRDSSSSSFSSASASYGPPGVFTNFEDLKGWMTAVGKRVAEMDDMRLVIFIDQIEEIYQKPLIDNIPAKIIDLLVQLKYPVVIAALTLGVIPNNNNKLDDKSVITGLPTFFKDPLIFSEMKMPARFTFPEFDLFLDVFEESKKFTPSDNSLIHDLRVWTGSIPGQISHFFRVPRPKCLPSTQLNNNGLVSIKERLFWYRMDRNERVQRVVEEALIKMDKLPKLSFLLMICRMILHAPTDDPTITQYPLLSSLFLPSALQKFYHPGEGVVTYRNIPTATSLATHFALCNPVLLSKVAGKWAQVLETVLASVMNAKTVCGESKRRVVRFYSQYKLMLLSQEPWLSNINITSTTTTSTTTSTSTTVESDVNLNSAPLIISGLNQFNDPISVNIPGPITFRRIIFSGLSPNPELLPSCYNPDDGSLIKQPLLFIPARTDYWFYDFFIAVPTERILYAFSTVAFQGTNGTGQQHFVTGTGSALSSGAGNALLTPLSLLDAFLKDLKDAGFTKYSYKCVYVKPADLLQAVGSTWKPEVNVNANATDSTTSQSN